ncbi:hypothetical protein FD755_010126, partial [Muntiacus reevesi]
DGYRRVVNLVPKKPPLLDRPGEGSYNRYYSHVDYRNYDEGRSFSHDRRSGPPHRGSKILGCWTKWVSALDCPVLDSVSFCYSYY